MVGADMRCRRRGHLALGGLAGERGCTAVPWDPYLQTACSNVNTPTPSHEDLLPGHRGKALRDAATVCPENLPQRRRQTVDRVFWNATHQRLTLKKQENCS